MGARACSLSTKHNQQVLPPHRVSEALATGSLRSLTRTALLFRLEVGASLCIFHCGRCVLNVTGGGFNNVTSGPSYDGSTLQVEAPKQLHPARRICCFTRFNSYWS